jgi:hypothetical protein
MSVHVRYGSAGKSAIPVAYAEPVMLEIKPLAYQGKNIPEVALRHRIEINHIAGMLMRDD